MIKSFKREEIAMAENIRLMTGANIYYPAEKDKLIRLIDDSMNADDIKIDKNPFAIINNYGHYGRASQLYAASFRQVLKKKYDTIVIIGPVHKIAFPGIALTKYDAFSTPFGNLNVDTEACSALHSYNKEFFVYMDKYHETEYCIENQLPYIARLFGTKVRILPVLLGEFNTKFTIMLAEALKKLVEKGDKKYLFIAVSNLSTELNYEDTVKMCNRFADYLINFNPDRLSEQLAMREIVAKGGGCIVALQRLSQLMKHDNLRVVRVGNSGDFGDEKDKVEGYISAVIW